MFRKPEAVTLQQIENTSKQSFSTRKDLFKYEQFEDTNRKEYSFFFKEQIETLRDVQIRDTDAQKDDASS